MILMIPETVLRYSAWTAKENNEEREAPLENLRNTIVTPRNNKNDGRARSSDREHA